MGHNELGRGALDRDLTILTDSRASTAGIGLKMDANNSVITLT
jgi:hypothetical protein